MNVNPLVKSFRADLVAVLQNKPRITHVERNYWRVRFPDNHVIVARGFAFTCSLIVELGRKHARA